MRRILWIIKIGEEYEQRDFFYNSCKKEIALAKDKGEGAGVSNL